MTDTNTNDLDAELEALEAERAAHKAETEKRRKAQRVIDLRAIMALETEYGDTNICTREVAYVEGLPTLIAGRTPQDPEIKRYRHRIASGRRPGQDPDPLAGVKASEEIADTCRVYPDEETYAKLRAARPGIHVQLGAECVKLATASAENEGKA